jgi:enamine deaminase RidA (YjgF/YER057c/UK114 family)
VLCAGQGSVDADGAALHPGDMGAQLTQALDNLEVVLEQAGTDLSHVVRLNYYTTDVDGLLGQWQVLAERMGRRTAAPLARCSASRASRSRTCSSRSKPPRSRNRRVARRVRPR